MREARGFSTELAIRLLGVKSHQHGKGGRDYILYADAVRVAHDLYYERHPENRP